MDLVTILLYVALLLLAVMMVAAQFQLFAIRRSVDAIARVAQLVATQSGAKPAAARSDLPPPAEFSPRWKLGLVSAIVVGIVLVVIFTVMRDAVPH